MTTIRMTVPDGALDEDRRARLRTELGPAVLEVVGDGRAAFVELDEARNGGWGAGGDLAAEPGACRSFVRVSLRPGQLDDLGRLVLAHAVHAVVEDVLGPGDPWEARRSWVVVEDDEIVTSG